MKDPDEFSGVPITRTGLLCTLGSCAARGELLLTESAVGDEAENIKAKMKDKEQLADVTSTPVPFSCLPAGPPDIAISGSSERLRALEA